MSRFLETILSLFQVGHPCRNRACLAPVRCFRVFAIHINEERAFLPDEAVMTGLCRC
jgi:hypothetical protein